MNWIELTLWFCCALVLYTYVIYPALLFVVSIFVHKPRYIDEAYLPSVTMLIAAFNEDQVIEEKLRNCLALDYPSEKLQFLIGSDASTDRTDEIVTRWTSPNLALIPFSSRRGKAAVLNDLVAKSNSEILVFSDANTIYRSDAILRLVAHFSDAKVGGVCGRLVLLNQADQAEADGERAYWDYENYLKHLEGKIRTVIGANGAIYAIRRALYCNLPTNKVVMDDFLIPLKIVQCGYDIIYERDAVVTEFTAPSIRIEFKRKVRIGAANFHGIREILPLLNPARGFVAFGLWSHKIIRWFVPFLLLAIFACNLALLGSRFYNVLFALQALFYSLAGLAWQMDRRGKQWPLLIYPYYFVAVNLALLLGFFKFLTGTQKPAWARTER